MPSPKAQDTVEFGWSGTDGYIRNGGKYNLLTSKPSMSFAYDTVMYSTDPTVEDVRTVGTQVFPLQPNEMNELNQYAVANSVSDPWNPKPVPVPQFVYSEEHTMWLNNATKMKHTGDAVFEGDVTFHGNLHGLPDVPTPVIQNKEIVDSVGLSGAGYTEEHSVLFMTLIAENDGTPAVRYRLVSHGTFSVSGTQSSIKTLNLSISGMFSSSQYAVCDHIWFDGITTNSAATRLYEYRVNRNNRHTNDLQFIIQVETNQSTVQGKCEFVIEFTLPNQDYGNGVPFPTFPQTLGSKQRVFKEVNNED